MFISLLIYVFVIPVLFYHLDPALIKLQFSNRNYGSTARLKDKLRKMAS